MKKLIVNADDFGLTDKVSQAILDGHGHGLISSASLLANGEAFDSAVALARQAPRLGVGVHLNLTEGQPVAARGSIPSLVDGQGSFARTPASLWRAITLGRVSLTEIEKELRAQVEKVFAAGIVPTHLDSHKHVHALGALGAISIRIARAYSIPAIRCVAERWSALGHLLGRHPGAATTIVRQRINGFFLARASKGWTGQLSEAGIACPCRFFGLTPTGFLDEEILSEILRRVPEGTSELMCHPGYVDNALRQTPTRLLEQREVEYHALTRPGLVQLARELGIQLVSYRDIACHQSAGAGREASSNRV